MVALSLLKLLALVILTVAQHRNMMVSSTLCNKLPKMTVSGYVCPEGKSSNRVTINDGDSFEFSVEPESGVLSCSNVFKLGESCFEMGLNCKEFKLTKKEALIVKTSNDIFK